MSLAASRGARPNVSWLPRINSLGHGAKFCFFFLLPWEEEGGVIELLESLGERGAAPRGQGLSELEKLWTPND